MQKKIINEAFLIDNDEYAVEVLYFKDSVNPEKLKTYELQNKNNYSWFLIGEDGEIDNKEPKSFKKEKDAEKWIKDKKLKSKYKEVRIVSGESINKCTRPKK